MDDRVAGASGPPPIRRTVSQIEHFFVSYNAIAGKRFTPLKRSGAQRLIREAQHRFGDAGDTG